MMQSDYTRLIQHIDTTFITRQLKALLAIKSENPFHEKPRPGYREQEMAEYYAEQMRALGLEVSLRTVKPGRPNVFGILKGRGQGKTIMLEGHLDTARTDGYAAAYDITEAEGKIFGRGACDMKAAFAAYLEVVRLLRAAGICLAGDLILAGVVDEEFQMLGAKDVGRHGPRADQAIVGEPTELRVCPVSKGRISTYIRTFGRAAHSSVPEQGENAILSMSRALLALSSYNDELLHGQSHPLLGHGRFNPGCIQGGSQVNIVPDLCQVEVDRRILPGETREQIYAELRTRLDALCLEDSAFRYEISEPTWDILPNEIAVEEPVVQSLLAAYSQAMGVSTQPQGFAAGADAAYLGIPSVICGPGSIRQAHTTNEFVAIDQLVNAVKMYLWVVLDLLS